MVIFVKNSLCNLPESESRWHLWTLGFAQMPPSTVAYAQISPRFTNAAEQCAKLTHGWDQAIIMRCVDHWYHETRPRCQSRLRFADTYQGTRIWCTNHWNILQLAEIDHKALKSATDYWTRFWRKYSPSSRSTAMSICGHEWWHDLGCKMECSSMKKVPLVSAVRRSR